MHIVSHFLSLDVNRALGSVVDKYHRADRPKRQPIAKITNSGTKLTNSSPKCQSEEERMSCRLIYGIEDVTPLKEAGWGLRGRWEI